jgi:hypothetical protein
MPAQPSVEDDLTTLVHVRKDAVTRLRDVVRAALPGASSGPLPTGGP